MPRPDVRLGAPFRARFARPLGALPIRPVLLTLAGDDDGLVLTLRDEASVDHRFVFHPKDGDGIGCRPPEGAPERWCAVVAEVSEALAGERSWHRAVAKAWRRAGRRR